MCPDCDVSLVLHRGQDADRLPSLRAPRGGARRAATTAARCRSRGTGRAPSGSSHELAEAGHPVFRLDADTPRAAARPGRVRGGAARRPRRHADGGQGPRLPRRDPRRGARRRRHAALPRLPRRGADVRARRPAGRPRRPRRGARPRARADDRARRAVAGFAARHDAEGFLAGELERRGRCATRRSRRSSGSSAPRPSPARRGRGRGGARGARPCRRWARRRCSACAAASAASSSSRPATGAPRSPTSTLPCAASPRSASARGGGLQRRRGPAVAWRAG